MFGYGGCSKFLLLACGPGLQGLGWKNEWMSLVLSFAWSATALA